MVTNQDLVLGGTGRQVRGPRYPKSVAVVFLKALPALIFLPALLVFASATLPSLAGLKTMAVSSASMEPAIRVGDAVVLRPAPSIESIQAGDVITFSASGVQSTTTHRVTAVKEIQGRTYFQTRGDANPTPDPDMVPAEAVFGKAVLMLPRAGYFLYLATSPWGKVATLGVPSLVMMVWVSWNLLHSGKPSRPDRGQPKHRKVESYAGAAPR